MNRQQLEQAAIAAHQRGEGRKEFHARHSVEIREAEAMVGAMR